MVQPLAIDLLPHVRVTVLADNICGHGPVLGEWGLSFLIDTGRSRLLLDAGAGHVLEGNAGALGVDLSAVEALVVSHGHYDHTDGIEVVLRHAAGVRVFAHPDVFVPKYWKTDRGAEVWRVRPARDTFVAHGADVVETASPTFVSSAVLVTGQIPRVTDFEDTGLEGRVFLDEEMSVPDPIVDDQAVVVRVPQGVVVLLGCGHAGLINTLWHVRQLVGVDRIHAVMGGTHLIAADPRRMARTIAELRALGVERILLSHCTGVDAYAQLVQAFPGRCSWPGAGTVVTFGS